MWVEFFVREDDVQGVVDEVADRDANGKIGESALDIHHVAEQVGSEIDAWTIPKKRTQMITVGDKVEVIRSSRTIEPNHFFKSVRFDKVDERTGSLDHTEPIEPEQAWPNRMKPWILFKNWHWC